MVAPPHGGVTGKRAIGNRRYKKTPSVMDRWEDREPPLNMLVSLQVFILLYQVAESLFIKIVDDIIIVRSPPGTEQ